MFFRTLFNSALLPFSSFCSEFWRNNRLKIAFNTANRLFRSTRYALLIGFLCLLNISFNDRESVQHGLISLVYMCD